jgi:hypothetical protein
METSNRRSGRQGHLFESSRAAFLTPTTYTLTLTKNGTGTGTCTVPLTQGKSVPHSPRRIEKAPANVLDSEKGMG